MGGLLSARTPKSPPEPNDLGSGGGFPFWILKHWCYRFITCCNLFTLFTCSVICKYNFLVSDGIRHVLNRS